MAGDHRTLQPGALPWAPIAKAAKHEHLIKKEAKKRKGGVAKDSGTNASTVRGVAQPSWKNGAMMVLMLSPFKAQGSIVSQRVLYRQPGREGHCKGCTEDDGCGAEG